LWDDNPNPNALTPNIPNRVGKVFPDLKIIVIDDEELLAAMSYKSNRNWTLPAPKVSLITPNICGLDNNSVEGILTGNTEYLYVTYRLSNDLGFTNSLHCNYYQNIQGPNVSCNPISSQNVSVRFGDEFLCLSTANTSITPCWYTGFTFWGLPQPETSPNTYIAYPFINTEQNLNGYPIFRSLVDEGAIYNIFYDGNDWIFRNNNYSEDEIINFTNGGLIGDFTIDFEGGVTGYTECNYNPLLCVTLCIENESCVTSTYTNTLSGSTNLYLSNFDVTSRLVYYNSAWEIYSADTRIAILTGLTNNDIPIGTWTPDVVPLTGLTTSLFETCGSITCSSYSASTTANSATIKVVDCSFIISDETIITSGITYSGCAITLDGSLDSAIVQVSGETTYGSYTGTCPTYSAVTASTICSEFCNVQNGFIANKFEIICQKIDGNGRPEPTEWKIIDFTDQLSGSTINGFLTQSGLTGNTFVITQDLYDNADTYVLTDYIHLPTGTTTNLNFGDEYDPITGKPVLPTKESFNNRDLGYADFNSGIMLTGYANERSTYYVGGSFYHITRPVESFLLVNNAPKINQRLSLSAGGNIQMNDNLLLLASALFQKQGPATELLLGGAVGFIMNPMHDEYSANSVLFLGTWYRLQDAICPYVGFEWGKSKLAFSYDVNVSSFAAATKGQGAMEISYVYNGCIVKNETRKYNFACPRF
jgi:hypothetical protein